MSGTNWLLSSAQPKVSNLLQETFLLPTRNLNTFKSAEELLSLENNDTVHSVSL